MKSVRFFFLILLVDFHVVVKEVLSNEPDTSDSGYETTARNVDALIRRVAYRLQEFHLGGLSEEDAEFLDELAEKDELANLVNAPAAKARKNAGTRYVREWHGKTYEVIFREDGKYELEGAFYSSLSAAAFAITGTHWNGKLFFGVK